jgi:hypothetical protein
VLLTTHLTARVLFDAMVRRAGTTDIYRLLRLTGRGLDVPVAEVCAGVDTLRRRLADHPEAGRVHPRVCSMQPSEVVDDALRALGTYHSSHVARRRGEVISIDHRRLLYYYRNRTAHLGAE